VQYQPTMKLNRFLSILTALLVATPVLFAEKVTLRVGHFPNITHAQALVARQLDRLGKGWFKERLGPDVEIEWYMYNAGPSAMEAILTKAIDLSYVGPSPALNIYQKSGGTEIRVLAGAANGGSGLIVQGDGRITKPEDFRGKKLATPQMGNTQDVAARVWLKKHGYRITQSGGDVNLMPTANPEQLSLFQTGQIDAVWTVEPWLTRLELEAKGKLYLEEKDAITTVLVSSVAALKAQPALVKKFVEAHAELTRWINEHPAEAKELVRLELKKLTKREFPAETTDRAWSRLHLTSEIALGSLETLLKEAQSVGFLKGFSDLSQFVQIPK
jgi:NitT/TauT family transport system substrate-binding protein